jgi:hypothetical protein
MARPGPPTDRPEHPTADLSPSSPLRPQNCRRPRPSARCRDRERPDERQAAGLAGEPADHLGAALDLAEWSLEQVRAPPPAAVPGRVAQVDDERLRGRRRGIWRRRCSRPSRATRQGPGVVAFRRARRWRHRVPASRPGGRRRRPAGRRIRDRWSSSGVRAGCRRSRSDSSQSARTTPGFAHFSSPSPPGSAPRAGTAPASLSRISSTHEAMSVSTTHRLPASTGR